MNTLQYALIGLGLGLIAACGDASNPRPDDFYDWRMVTPSPSGTGVDSLTFHWTPDRLPVRIWVEDAAGMPGHVSAGLSAWARGVSQSRFNARLVNDSAGADVIVRAAPAPFGTQFSRVRLARALAPECDGATDVFVSDDHTQLQLPVRIYVDPRTDPDAPGLEACLALTTTHELGHALGIWQHSDSTSDLMFADPIVSRPSDRDLATVQVLYGQAPNVTATGP
jgi:hypothetical protein